jgi:hypothetical protein
MNQLEESRFLTQQRRKFLQRIVLLAFLCLSSLKLEKEFGRILDKSKAEINERSISLRFLGLILRCLRLEVSVYSVYISNQFQTTFAQGEVGGRKIGK